MTLTLQDNPLLDWQSLPRFDEIEAQHVEPAIERLLADIEVELQALEQSGAETWSDLLDPLEHLEERLSYTWSAVRHLQAVRNTPELRAAYEKMQPAVVKFSMRLGQSKALYQKFRAMRDGAGWPRLEPAQQRIIDSALRAARHAGVELEGAERDRFNEIQLQLAQLSTRFGNQLLDFRREYQLLLDRPDEVVGLPSSLRELSAQRAREAGHEQATAEHGPWLFSLDPPSLRPFLEHSPRRDLRERLYRDSIQQACQPPHDNTPLIDEMLALRHEKAQLLGYPDHAAVSLASKMAPNVEAVEKLLEELRQAAYPCAVRDRDELAKFAAERGADHELRHWDMAFWAERLREERYAISEEQLRQYFPLPKVLEGLFALAGRLFGIRIEAADGEVQIWHPEVRFFRVFDADGSERAAFYLDPYSRPSEKRGGAWMDDCVTRSRMMALPGNPVRLPVAYLVCNQTPPVNGRPSLMTFDEVTTLFHEFGHGLQHMLTDIDISGAAGTNNIEWDAVEIPSLFLENWCYHLPTLRSLGGHFETGNPLPTEWEERLIAARNYRSGPFFLRQLLFGLTDLALHHGFTPGGDESPFDVMRRIADRTTLLQPLPEDRFLCTFSHLFAGSYAAGYYSYHWAHVLSADAFAAFEEAGLADEQAVRRTGRRFRTTFLALGGSQPPSEVYRAFRGRDPSSEALLRHAGLTAAPSVEGSPS